MYKQSGSQAYARVGLESGIMSATPHQLVVMLFDGAHNALVRARLLLEQGDIIGKGKLLSKAIDIIDNGLKAGLNLEQGGGLAENLSALYDYLSRRLLQANLHNDAQAISEVIDLLSPIADAWRQIGSQSHDVSQDAR